MKTPERLFDYFTLEAGEQLTILEEEAQSEQPNAGRFVAAARRLTQSAQMARLTSLAEISGGIERIAKELVRNQIPWTADLRDAVLDGLRELRLSVARVKKLDEADYIRLRRRSREVLRFTKGEVPANTPVQISSLFYDDAGPHIVRLASANPSPSFSESREQELKDLLGASIAKLGGNASQLYEPEVDEGPVVPVEDLLYRGTAALDRAREIASRARSEKRTPPSKELSELYDLIELAATEGP